MEPNPILSAPDDALVCWCGKVDKKTILKAIADGNDTVEKLKTSARKTGIASITIPWAGVVWLR